MSRFRWRRRFSAVFLFTFLDILAADFGRPARAAPPPKHLTKIACEGEILNITCPVNHVINIIRANYGRFSLLECNERSETWENFQCMYPKSTRVMEERCNNRPSCVVLATSQTFGDPCSNVSKYLEVLYSCSNNITGASSMLEGSDTSTGPVMTPEDRLTSPYMEEILRTLMKPQPSFCPETARRGIQWPATRVNHSAKIACPNSDDEHLYAEWHCSADGAWTSDHPDLSRCVSSWARDLEMDARRIRKVEDGKRVLSELQSKSPAFGGDVKIAVQSISRVLHALPVAMRMSSVEGDVAKEAIAKNFTLMIANMSSSLLRSDTPWSDLPMESRVDVADELLSSMEVASTLGITYMNESSSISFMSASVALEISSFGEPHDGFHQFPSRPFHSDDPVIIQIPASVIPSSSFDIDAHSTIAIISYDRSFGNHLTPSDTHNTSYIASRRVVSRLTSIIITQFDPSTQQHKVQKLSRLVDPILITFAVQIPRENASKTECVYWEPSKKDWSPEGCAKKDENQTHITCACHHLTTFAILMDVYGVVMAVEHQLALLFITYIGCIISIISCALAVMAFCCFRASNHTDRITIHKNLCLCLFMAEATFLFGIDNADFPALCTVIAALLHYLFLAAFAWMLLEGVELYALLIEVFEPEHSRRRYFYLFGYGAPLVIVGASLTVDRNSYGTNMHCWLNTDNYFVYSFVGPVAVVLMANFLFLIMALVVMCRHANFSTSYRQERERRSFLDNISLWLKGAMTLAILLGLTWTLGLLYIIHSTVVLAYAFTALNSLQGLFIFVFHVLLNQQMRKDIHARFHRRLSSQRPSWMRTPNGSVDFKQTKPSSEDPTPMLLANSVTLEDSSRNRRTIFERLCGQERRQNNKKGSVGPLVSSSSSGHTMSNGAKRAHNTYRSDDQTNTIDDTMALSEPLTDMSNYTISSPRSPPPNFSPPPPPKPVPAQRRGRNVATSALDASKTELHDEASSEPLVNVTGENSRESRKVDFYEKPTRL